MENEGSLDQHWLAPDVTGRKLVNGFTVSVAVLAETDLGKGGGGTKGGWKGEEAKEHGRTLASPEWICHRWTLMY